MAGRVCDLTPMCASDEGFDAGVNAGGNSGEAPNVEGKICAPASGAQGVKRMKVSKGKHVHRCDSSNVMDSVSGKKDTVNTLTKIDVMREKFRDEKMRHDAAFARDVYADPNMPEEIRGAARDMLLRFFGCATSSSTHHHPLAPQHSDPVTPTDSPGSGLTN